MLRTWGRWIRYPLVMVVVLLVATIPHSIERSRQADAATNQFTVTDFTADYVLEPRADGTTDVLVTERIEADFPRRRVNRGIFRAIPLHYQDHRNTVTDVEVTGDVRVQPRSGFTPEEVSGPQPFTQTTDNGILIIRIGDPELYLDRGTQVWEIRYRLGDVAMNTPDGRSQEIYLDVNGSGWEVPFDKVTGRLRVPGNLARGLDGNTACYRGEEGSTAPCDRVTTMRQGDTTVVAATATDLDRRSNLTFAVGFEPGTFPRAYTPTREPWPWWLFVLPAIGLLFYLVSLVRYLRARGVGRPRVLVTEYLPPPGLPAIAAADIMGRPERGPTAQLIEFVEAGVLTLRLREPLQPRHDGPPTRVGFLRRRRLRRALDIPAADFDAIEDEGLRELMQGHFLYGLGERPDPESTAELAERQEWLVVRRGWREWGPDRPGWFGWMMFGFLVAGGLGIYAIHPRGPDFWWAVSSAVIGVVLLIAALYRHPAFGPLTDEGRRIRTHLLGLKHFIGMSEANRIAWLQGVDSAPVVRADDHAVLVKLYEPLLPYAIIFGQEKSWTAVLGEHQRVVPASGQWLGALQSLPLEDALRTLDHRDSHRAHRSTSGFRSISAVNETIGSGFRGAGEVMGDALSVMADSRNDGGGSRRGAGGSGRWSSGGSRGGGRSGGGMGGGGGGGW